MRLYVLLVNNARGLATSKAKASLFSTNENGGRPCFRDFVIFYIVYASIRTLDLTLGLRCHVIMDFHDQGSTLVGGYTK